MITKQDRILRHVNKVAEYLMDLECPVPGMAHQKALCPRCQASFTLAKLLEELESE